MSKNDSGDHLVPTQMVLGWVNDQYRESVCICSSAIRVVGMQSPSERRCSQMPWFCPRFSRELFRADLGTVVTQVTGHVEPMVNGSDSVS